MAVSPPPLSPLPPPLMHPTVYMYSIGGQYLCLLCALKLSGIAALLVFTPGLSKFYVAIGKRNNAEILTFNVLIGVVNTKSESMQW